MCFFALLRKSPQICSKMLHDSTLMILWGAGISSLNITGVYILFSRFGAPSVLTQTQRFRQFFVVFNNYQRSSPINPCANTALGGRRSTLLHQETRQSHCRSMSGHTAFFRKNVQQMNCFFLTKITLRNILVLKTAVRGS